jgi:hypothetical protein
MKTFALSLLIPLALICSCKKQDSNAEQQLTQQKAELDARQKELDEKEKALEGREKLLVKPRVPSVPRIAPVASAEPHQTLPPELTGLVADPSKLRAEREQRMQERLAARQHKIEEVQRRRLRVSPPVQATAPSPQEATSPSPSPTPE